MSNTLGILISVDSVDFAADAKKVLGLASSSSSVICQSDKIKKFARYKPEIHAQITRPTDAQRHLNAYGLSCRPATLAGGSPYSVADLSFATAAWTYNKPTGGAAAPWRVADLGGYLHVPMGPASKPSSSNIGNTSDTGPWIAGSANFTAYNQGSLHVADLYWAFGGLYPYLCMLIRQQGAALNTVKAITTATPITADTSGVVELQAQMPTDATRTYEIAMCLSSVCQPTFGDCGEAFLRGQFWPIPSYNPAAFLGTKRVLAHSVVTAVAADLCAYNNVDGWVAAYGMQQSTSSSQLVASILTDGPNNPTRGNFASRYCLQLGYRLWRGSSSSQSSWGGRGSVTLSRTFASTTPYTITGEWVQVNGLGTGPLTVVSGTTLSTTPTYWVFVPDTNQLLTKYTLALPVLPDEYDNPTRGQTIDITVTGTSFYGGTLTPMIMRLSN